jgi:hypothetical protein
MSRKGGSTIIRPWDFSWFGWKVPKSATLKNRKESAAKSPFSLREKAEFEALKESAPTIKPEPSVVHREITVI